MKFIESLRDLKARISRVDRATNELIDALEALSADNSKMAIIRTLTPSEKEVFDLLGENLTTKQIAGKLKKSPKTIEHHRRTLRKALGAKSAKELTELVQKHLKSLG